MMSAETNDDGDFQLAIKEIIYLAPIKLQSPFDRVRVMEWICKLLDKPTRTPQKFNIHKAYVNYLKMMLDSASPHISLPFKERPPIRDLAPLMEVLGNAVNTKWANLPPTGPIQPVVCNKSDDGKSFMAVKRCPDGGVLCYMAVTPNPLANES